MGAKGVTTSNLTASTAYEDPQMKTDSETWREWVDRDLEGELSASEKARLEAILEAQPRARAERRALASLHRMMAEDRVAVRPGFSARVMAALPAMWWERRPAAAPRPWALPVALMLVLALGAALVLGNAEEPGRLAGVGLALLDFAQVTLLAGAGMLFAAWRGVGFGLEQLIADSGLNFLALASAVVFVNLLFFSLLRRKKAVASSADSSAAED